MIGVDGIFFWKLFEIWFFLLDESGIFIFDQYLPLRNVSKYPDLHNTDAVCHQIQTFFLPNPDSINPDCFRCWRSRLKKSRQYAKICLLKIPTVQNPDTWNLDSPSRFSGGFIFGFQIPAPFTRPTNLQLPTIIPKNPHKLPKNQINYNCTDHKKNSSHSNNNDVCREIFYSNIVQKDSKDISTHNPINFLNLLLRRS